MQDLWILNHALERRSSRMEASVGITAQQRFVIRCVGKYPGMTAGHLADLLQADPGTVSTALRRLEDRGLVVRRKDPRDGRRITLGLTPKGHELGRPAAGTVEAAVERLLCEAPRGDVEVARRLLGRLRALLDEG